MSKTNKKILIICFTILVMILPVWLCNYRICEGDGFKITDPDSLFYYRIVDQAYQKGSEKFLDYDNYGNFPYSFKIGYPRFYYWLFYSIKKICVTLFPHKAEFLLGLFPVITTTLTALLIVISFCLMRYPAVFLLFTAFMLLPNPSALSVGSFGKFDYDHILSLYIWAWLLSSMFYQDSGKRKWLCFGGIAAGLIFGSWIGSLLLFFVVTVVCFLLWLFNSKLCEKYLPYCYTTFGISAVINTLVVIISPSRYGLVLLDFGIIHIIAVWLAVLGIYTLSKLNPSNKSKTIFFCSAFIIFILFIVINPTDFKDLVDRVSGTDPIFLEINELQPLIVFKNLFINISSIENAIINYNLFIIMFPFFIFISAKKLLKRESACILQLWLIIVVFASFYQNRYIRIFGVGSSIFTAFILYYLWNSLSLYIDNTKLSKLRIVCVFILLLLIVRASSAWSIHIFNYKIRQSELLAYEWIKNNTPVTSGYYDNKKPEYGILAYWDFGHVINYYARRPVIANNMQNGVKNMADIFSSKTEEEAYNICEKLGVKYVYLTPDRVLYPSTIDYWPAYKNQESAPGYKSLPYNVERSKDYNKWFYTWLNEDYGLRSRGDFEVTSKFRVIFANAEHASSFFSTMFFERVRGAKLILQGLPNSVASIALGVKIGNRIFNYRKDKKVSDSGYVCFNLPYSCYFNNGFVFTGEFYDFSLVSHETNKQVRGKVSIKEKDVLEGNQVATNSILIFR